MKRILCTSILLLAASISNAAVLVQDTFTDTDGTDIDDHAPDVDVVGNGWVTANFSTEGLAPNAVEIQGNQLVENQEEGAIIDAGAADVVMTFDWTLGTGTNRIVAILRYLDPTDRMQLAIGEGTIELIARVGGSNTSVASQPFNFVDGNTYTIEIAMSGSSYDVSVDGSPELSTSSTANQTNTRYGVFIGSVDVPQAIDNMLIETAAEPVIEDTFTDANGTELTAHTPDIDTVGTGWELTNLGGGFPSANEVEIQNNKLEIDMADGGGGALIDSGESDVTIEFDWTLGVGDNRIAVLIRSDGTEQNRNYIQMRDPQGDIRLVTTVGGVGTNHLDEPFNWVDGTTYHVRVVVSGDDYEVFVDGNSEYAETASANNTQTHHGLMVGGIDVPQVFDNFTVTPGVSGGGGGIAPAFTVTPTVQSTTNTSYTLSYTADSAATFSAVACNPGNTIPTTNQVKAGQCGGGSNAEASVSEAVTGADTSVLSGIVFPRHDIYSVLSNGNGDSAVSSLTDENRSPDPGQEFIVLTSVSGTSPFSDASYFSPDVAAGDVIEADSATSPGGFAITWDTDGDFLYTDPSGSPQSIDYCIQDTSDTTGEFTSPACWAADDTILINDSVPTCDQDVVTLVFAEGDPIVPIDLDDFCTDESVGQLTYTVTAGVLPEGLSLGGDGNSVLSGTPSIEDEGGETITFTASNAGSSDVLTRTIYIVNTVTLPDYTDSDFVDAQLEHQAAFPWQDEVTSSLFLIFTCHETEPSNLVASQNPAALTEVDPFEVVTIRVSLGITCSEIRRRRL